MSVIVKETLCEDDDDDDDDDNDDTGDKSKPDIPLPNVSAFILAKVIEYCKHYQQVEVMTPITTPLKSSKLEELVQPWYAEYVKVDRTILFDLVAAANFMDIKPLLDLTCLAVSIQIKGRSAAELREMFNLSNEITPDEEAQIQRENAWIDNPNNTAIAAALAGTNNTSPPAAGTPVAGGATTTTPSSSNLLKTPEN